MQIVNKILIIILLSTFLMSDTTDTISLKIPVTSNASIKDSLYDFDLFESLLSEAKLFYADAIIADLIGDTLDAMYQFDNFF